MTSTRKRGRKSQYNKLKKRKNSKNSRKRGKRGKLIKSNHVVRNKGGSLESGLYINFNKKVYEFIDANLGLFVIDDFTKDHSIDMDCLKTYIKFQKEGNKKSVAFWNFYEYLYKNIMYISNSNIIDQYKKNAYELHNLSTNRNANGMKNHLVLLLPDDVSKSNYYFTLYFLHLYRNIYPNDYENIDILSETDMKKGTTGSSSDENKINFDYDSKHTIYITTDDFSYSGEQIELKISYEYQDHLPHRIHGQTNNYSIYINVFGMTGIALETINSLNFWVKIQIPDKCMIINNKTYPAIFDKYCKEYNYKIKPESVDMLYFTAKYTTLRSFTKSLIEERNSPLIYLSYKYPDSLSFPTRLCYFKELPNTYFIAHDEENIVTYKENIEEYSMDDVMFREKCSEMDFVFQLKSMELFKEKYPKLVHTVDTNESGIVHVLKLVKNCNYGPMNFHERPHCTNFCYKPFYKKQKYIEKMTAFSLQAGLAVE